MLDNQQRRPGTASNTDMEGAARSFDEIAAELEAAAKHAKIAASHMRKAEVPRYTAHAFAVIGHVANAKTRLDDAACLHASKSATDDA